MEIIIDDKALEVSDPDKNLVEIAYENGIIIPAPCFKEVRRYGCCKVCAVEIDGKIEYACCQKPRAGMKIIFSREDLKLYRSAKIKSYAAARKRGEMVPNSCSCKCECGTECC